MYYIVYFLYTYTHIYTHKYMPVSECSHLVTLHAATS